MLPDIRDDYVPLEAAQIATRGKSLFRKWPESEIMSIAVVTLPMSMQDMEIQYATRSRCKKHCGVSAMSGKDCIHAGTCPVCKKLYWNDHEVKHYREWAK